MFMLEHVEVSEFETLAKREILMQDTIKMRNMLMDSATSGICLVPL